MRLLLGRVVWGKLCRVSKFTAIYNLTNNNSAKEKSIINYISFVTVLPELSMGGSNKGNILSVTSACR